MPQSPSAARIEIHNCNLRGKDALNTFLSAGHGKQLLFAVSPLIVLGYILLSAFEPEEVEMKKRKKKADFNLEGHAE